MTAIILSTSYKGKEFFRIGYYVYNNYVDPVLLETPPEAIKLDAVYRNIFVDKPRITRFNLDWDEKKDSQALPKAIIDVNSMTQSTNFEAMKDQSQLEQSGSARFSEEECKENPFLDNIMEIESDGISKSFSFF